MSDSDAAELPPLQISNEVRFVIDEETILEPIVTFLQGEDPFCGPEKIDEQDILAYFEAVENNMLDRAVPSETPLCFSEFVMRLRELGASAARVQIFKDIIIEFFEETGVPVDMLGEVMMPEDAMVSFVKSAMLAADAAQGFRSDRDPHAGDEMKDGAGKGGSSKGSKTSRGKETSSTSASSGGKSSTSGKASDGRDKKATGAGGGAGGDDDDGKKPRKIKHAEHVSAWATLIKSARQKTYPRESSKNRFPAEGETCLESVEHFMQLTKDLTPPLWDPEAVQSSSATDLELDCDDMWAEWWTAGKVEEDITVFHGCAGHDYLNIIRQGYWKPSQSKSKGELYAGQAVYFATDPNRALWYSAMRNKVAMNNRLAESIAIVIMTTIPAGTIFARVRPEKREEFVGFNGKRDTVKNYEIGQPAFILSGFWQRWRTEFKDRKDFTEVLRCAHQLAFVPNPEVPVLDMPCNVHPSRVAIVKPEGLKWST